jgi:hypothetical protein
MERCAVPGMFPAGSAADWLPLQSSSVFCALLPDATLLKAGNLFSRFNDLTRRSQLSAFA